MRTGRRSQAQKVFEELGRIESILEDFHNRHSANHLANSNKDLSEEYIQRVIKQFRLLEAYSTEGKRAIYPFTNGKTIDAKNIDRILRGINLKCVNSFFSPTVDLWFEDSRASYQNKDAIDFIENPGEEITQLTRELEPIFLDLRNQLEYFSQEIS
ncbi:DUF3907 family protein [Allobacillus sp. GCM10007491]|uniref:DUF3907 family protein n=2 Tax=Allobacillus TaxID=1400133 RepID=A0A941CT99_9BACI|nr:MULTISPECIES: DUF3907 family protein [Allobacillus]MBR7553294.1 DUF3907 family protein [Allobacillus saliphilus]TSJ67604.1 DUF3907 family protein [Allobacillus salarius]